MTATAREPAIAVPSAPEPPGEERVRERLRAAFADLGLPEPTVEGFHMRSFEPR